MAAPVIMVQMDDHKWTLAALRRACAEASAQKAQVVLALLLPERHVVLGDIDVDAYVFSETECEELEAYTAIAQQHGVALSTRVFAYRDFDEGVTRAASELDAHSVYAHVPGDLFPFSQRHVRHLEHVLDASHRTLHSFEVTIA